MRCYVFIQTTKLHIFSIYGNFLLFIFYFLKDMRTEEQVFLKDMRTEEQVFLKTWEQKNMFYPSTKEHVLLFSCLTPRKQSPCSSVLLSYPSQAIPMFSCSPVLPLASNPHVLLFSCLIPRKQSPCSHVLLSSPKNMFFCLITMHIFLIPIKILNCFSLPFQISFILLYINILSLRNIENSIYTFYRNGTSTL